MEYTAQQMNKHIKFFTPIYGSNGEEANPMPDGVKLTVYCEGSDYDDRGFAENVTTKELGINAFIAKSWILQTHLDELMK